METAALSRELRERLGTPLWPQVDYALWKRLRLTLLISVLKAHPGLNRTLDSLL